MQSCHSPVNSVTGVPNVSTISPRKPVIPITLNGLFGDGYGFDESIATTLSMQSPINKNVSGLKIGAVSPSKSLSMELNYNQQPVLLSELADNVPYNLGTSGSLPRGSTLCSFVSPYDNSRCTDLAITKSSSTKSYCHKHSELAQSHQADGIPQLNSTATVHTSTSLRPATISKKPLSNQQSVSAMSQRQHLSNQQMILTNNKLAKRKTIQSPLVNGICYGDGRAVVSTPQPPDSNVIFPLTYISPREPSMCANGEKISSNVSPNVVRAVPILAATVVDPNGKPKPVQIKQGNVHPSRQGAAVPMDKDVLQAFVDFLNQNHDRLTPKQQLSLLNSLGVAVATVKNPDDFGTLSHQQAMAKPLRLVAQSTTCSANEKLVSQKESFTNKSKLVSNSSSALKRKLSCPRNNSKKLRNDNIPGCNNSLQHLTNKELNEKVQETIASMEFSPELCQESPKKKLKGNKMMASYKNTSSSYSVPSVSIDMNKLNSEILLKKKVSCEALNNYITQELNKEFTNQNLFPLGPFCDDDDFLLCTCTESARVLPIPAKIKNKILNQKKLKTKYCFKCFRPSNDSELPNLFKTILDTTNEMETVKYHQSSISSSKLSEDESHQEPRSSISHQFRCRFLMKSAKAWRKQQATENQSIRTLVAAAQANSAETAAVLKTLGQRTGSRLRSRARSGTTPSTCVLTDRSGHRCSNPSLPLASYCRDHIMHSNHQQLYKLDADMSVIADIYPDPPVVRQRKKTKLPPLSKRKKRRTRKKNVPELQSANSSLSKKVNHTADRLPANSTFSLTQSVISDYVVDNSDENLINVNSVRMPSVVDDPTLSFKNNLLTDNLSAPLDEEGASEMFEAFSFDGEELLHDVTPDMFSELGLDNAFLLTGAADSIDTLAFDELNDSESACLNGADENNKAADTSLQLRSAVAEPPKNSTSSPKDPSFSTNETINPSLSCITSNTVEQSNWPPVDKSTPVKNNYAETSTGFGDVSSSLDSSIAEDLNELEGVIQSLRDETLKSDIDAAAHCTWGAGSFNSTIEKDVSMNVEASLSAPPSVGPTENHFQVCNTAATASSNEHSLSVASSVPSMIPPNQQSVCSKSKPPDHVLTFLDSAPPINDQNDVLKNIHKKARKVNSSCKQNGALTPPSNQFTCDSGFINGLEIPSTSMDFKFNPQSKSTKTAIKANPLTNLAHGTNRAKDSTKTEFLTLNPTVPSATTNPLIRMQPRLMSTNVINTVKTTNQSMILIPVNAVVRSSNQMAAPGNAPNLGIAFAIPAQNVGSNVGTMIPIKGSAFLASSGSNQPVLFLGSNSPNNALPIQTNISFNQLHRPSGTPKFQQPDKLKSVATTSSINQPITIQSQSKPITSFYQAQLGRSPATSSTTSNNKPKRRFNRNSIVIPPAVSQGNLPHCAGSNPTPSPKPTQARTSVCTSTVHWNQTIGTVPASQHRSCDAVGAQTSNMLFCRRITPPLNNKQHVIVGRLGSLGQMGLTRVTVKDPPLKTPHLITESKSSSVSQQVAVPLSSDSPVAPETRELTLSSGVKSSGSLDESSQLRDLSNQIHLAKSDVGRDVAAAPPVSSASSSICHVPSTRHSSRKSGHSQMLSDPDFCESPTKLSQPDTKRTTDLPQKPPLQTNAAGTGHHTPSEIGLKSDPLLPAGKVARRATILRKR